MNESREQVIESLIKTILEKASQDDYSYDDWSMSKKQIKELCEFSTPNNLRFVIWKHIVQQGDQALVSDNNILNLSNDSNPTLSSSSSSTPIFQNETLNKDCLELTQEYNLISQIKSFNNSNSNATYSFDSFATIANKNSLLDQPDQQSNLLDAPLQPLNATPTLNSSNSSINSNNSSNSSTFQSPQMINDVLKTLTTESISERLSRFVGYFCNKTKREYSIDVVKLMIPFVVLSIVEEINTLKLQQSSPNKSSLSILHQNPSEQDWMSLSFKLIETISNSGIHPYPIANPILLCESEMFRILLLYHDPQLSHFLNSRTVNSMHYFYEWINHMFCGCIDIKFLIQIWDLFLYHNHQDFYMYFALALIISKREATLSIVKGNAKEILQVLEEKNIVNSLSNQIKLPGLIKKAEQLRSCTPLTFVRNWNKLFINCKSVTPKLDAIKLIYLEYKYAVCMHIDVEELILNSKWDSNNQQIVKEKFSYYCQDDELEDYPSNFFVFDCRIYKYYKAGKYPGAFHLPPGLYISSQSDFDSVIRSFLDMKGVTHFIFYDNWQQFNQPSLNSSDADSNDNGDMNMNILKFLKEGFPYVSKIPSGYKKIHDIFLAKGLELAVHFADSCPVCNPAAFNNTLPPSEPSSPIISSTPQVVEQTARDKWMSKLKSLTIKKELANANNTNAPNTTITTTDPSNNTTSTSSTTTTITAIESNESSLKTAFGFFRDKLKIRDKVSIYDTSDIIDNNSNVNNNNINNSFINNRSTPKPISKTTSPILNSSNSSIITPSPSPSQSPHQPALIIGSNRTPIKQQSPPVAKSLIDLDSINNSGKNSILDSNNSILDDNSNGILTPNKRGLNISSSNMTSLNTSNSNFSTLLPISNINSNNYISLNPINNNNSNNHNNSLNNNIDNNNNVNSVGVKPSLNSSINNSNSTSQSNLWNSGKAGPTTFYLPNLAPFINDFEDDENEAFEEGKKYYYYINENDYPKEAADEFVYDREKLQKEETDAENEFNKEYKGIEVWLDNCNNMFDCQEIEQPIIAVGEATVTSTTIENGTSSDIGSSANSTITTVSTSPQQLNRYIIITDKEIIALKEHPVFSGYVKVDYKYHLNSIHRIAYKKNTPNLLEFSYDKDEINNNSNTETIKEQEILNGSSDSSFQKDNIIKKSYVFNDSITDSILKAINKN